MSAAASSARAFTDPNYFWKSAAIGGTEGRWFSGAPTDGYGCDVCHSGKPSERLVIEGLPKSGYVPNKDYEIRIAWPDFAARTRGLFDTKPPAQWPTASLVTEIIAESGDNSGVILQHPLQKATPAELCHSTQKRLGSSVWRQAPRAETKTVSECDAVNATRCMVVVRGCGSEEVRFTWTSPPTWQGTIWFSTGFVATDEISKTPLADATTIVSLPIAPAGSDGYQSDLQQACAVTRVGTAHRSWLAPWAVFGVLWLVRARRRQQSRGGAR